LKKNSLAKREKALTVNQVAYVMRKKLIELQSDLQATQEEMVRMQHRYESQVENLRHEVESIKTAAINELQRIALTHKPFYVGFFPEEAKCQKETN
jgi:hypothetical protein